MNTKKIKKITSIALCSCIITASVPINIFAESPVFDFSVPSFSLNAPYIISNGIVYNFIKEPGNVSLGEVSVGNNQNINTEDIIIPNTITVKGKAYAVTKIEDGAFFTNNNIKTISFGKSINSVSSSAFTKCSSLEKINVSADNPYFKSIDGILYN